MTHCRAGMPRCSGCSGPRDHEPGAAQCPGGWDASVARSRSEGSPDCLQSHPRALGSWGWSWRSVPSSLPQKDGASDLEGWWGAWWGSRGGRAGPGRQEAEGLQPGGCDRQADAPSLRFSSTQRVVPHLSSRGYCELRGLSGPGSLGFPRRQPGARAGASPGKGVLKAGMARTQAPGCGQRHGGSSRSGRPRSQGPRPYPEPQADLPGGREALQGMEEQLVPAVEGAAQPPRPKPCALTPLRSSLWGQNVAALPLVCCTGLRCPRADSGQHACPHSRAGAHQSTARVQPASVCPGRPGLDECRGAVDPVVARWPGTQENFQQAGL